MKQLFKNKLLRSWALYDFSNSSYVLIFQSFLLPLYFSNILQGEYGFSKFSWGIANGVSTLIGLILAVLGGSYSDKKERLKVFKVFIFLTFLFITLFSISITQFPIISFYLFIVCNSFFIVTITLSNSLLKFISPNDKLGEYSGFAWGWGYVGGIICLLLVMLIQGLTSEFSLYVFLTVALYYFVFSAIAISGIKKSSTKIEFNPKPNDLSKKTIISFRDKSLLLFGYLLISGSITVIILFYSIYASEELKLSTQVIGVTLLFVQLIGFFSTWYGGKLSDQFGVGKLLGYSIIIWIAIILLLITTNDYISLSIIVLLTGLVIGNSQSYLRAQYTSIVEKYNVGYQFGLFAISTQAAVIVGPILHGYLSDRFNSQKIPMAILILFLIIGYIITLMINSKIKKNVLN